MAMRAAGPRSGPTRGGAGELHTWGEIRRWEVATWPQVGVAAGYGGPSGAPTGGGTGLYSNAHEREYT